MSSRDWSVPETDVLGAIHDACRSDWRAVLATIVRVEGGAYRRPGTKMLIDSDGDSVGSLTAGCLEDEVRSLARAVLESGASRIERFNLSGDDDRGTRRRFRRSLEQPRLARRKCYHARRAK